MKIYKIIAPLALLALFTACSDDDRDTSESNEYPVEIKLSLGRNVSSGITRSIVESDSTTGAFSIDSVGFFMLATDVQSTNPLEQDITWDASVNKWAVWLNNICAVADSLNGTTDLTWTLPAAESQRRWYPVGNWYSYRFYGYHPYTENIEIANEQVIARYNDLDGTKDIIHGTSLGADMTHPREKYRYCARYFRQSGYGNKYPSLDLKHKMMAIQFYIVGVADSTKDVANYYDEANTMGVYAIQTINVPTSCSLIVADLNDSTKNGKITYDWTVRDTIPMLGPNDTAFDPSTAFINNNDTIAIGQPMLLPVPDADATAAGFTKYQILVSLQKTNGQIFWAERPLDINLTQGSSYKPGYIYKVLLKIAGPQLVQVRATLEHWIEDNFNTVEPLIFN